MRSYDRKLVESQSRELENKILLIQRRKYHLWFKFKNKITKIIKFMFKRGT